MVKTIFRFFQMQIQRVSGYAIERGLPVFCIDPERPHPATMFLTVWDSFCQTSIMNDGDGNLHGPLIMLCSVDMEQSGTISAYTLPCRFNNPNTIVLLIGSSPVFAACVI